MGWPFVSQSSVLSTPANFIFSSKYWAARRTSSLCRLSALTEGILSQSNNSERKRSLLDAMYSLTTLMVILVMSLIYGQFRNSRTGDQIGLKNNKRALSIFPLEGIHEVHHVFFHVLDRR